MKTLFAVVAGVALLISVWNWLGPIGGATFLLAFLVVFAHVAGTAIGSKLRDSRRRETRQTQMRTDADGIRPEQFAPVTKLSRRTPLGFFMFVMTSLGVLLGGIGGILLMRYLYPATYSFDALMVGCLAGATLGGFWAFWIFSLMQVLGGAWWQAHRHGGPKR